MRAGLPHLECANIMNHKQRRGVAKALRAFRKKKDCIPNDVATILGWPLAFYLDAEAGKVGLSEGQMNDVRRMLRVEITAAGVRDRLRSPKRGGYIIRPEAPTGFKKP
jgi:hypothetical protein